MCDISSKPNIVIVLQPWELNACMTGEYHEGLWSDKPNTSKEG